MIDRSRPTGAAAGSVLGTRLAITRFGTKAVVTAGLVSLATSFAWISAVTPNTPYTTVAMQMVLLGGGLGLTTAGVCVEGTFSALMLLPARPDTATREQ